MDVLTGRVHETKTAHAGAIYDVAFSPDGTVFCTASEDGSVVLWNVAADTVICRFAPLGLPFRRSPRSPALQPPHRIF